VSTSPTPPVAAAERASLAGHSLPWAVDGDAYLVDAKGCRIWPDDRPIAGLIADTVNGHDNLRQAALNLLLELSAVNLADVETTYAHRGVALRHYAEALAEALGQPAQRPSR
jgi:hypothetical protein